MAVNRHFEGLVRIQEDRDHHVISNGPYAIVRHPGYVGMIVNFMAVPFVLDSLTGVVIMTLAMLLLVVRTALEDRKVIERAKQILIDQQGLTEAAAYTLLRRTAMEQSRKIADLARALVAAADLLRPGEKP